MGYEIALTLLQQQNHELRWVTISQYGNAKSAVHPRVDDKIIALRLLHTRVGLHFGSHTHS